MGNNQGYIWAPYIMATNTQVVDSSFKPKKLLNSRKYPYGQENHKKE